MPFCESDVIIYIQNKNTNNVNSEIPHNVFLKKLIGKYIICSIEKINYLLENIFVYNLMI